MVLVLLAGQGSFYQRGSALSRRRFSSRLVVRIPQSMDSPCRACHIGRGHSLPSRAHNPSHNTFSLYLAWAPLFYIYVFLILPRKQGVVYALAVYATSLAVGVPHFNHPASMDGPLAQFYSSNLVYIAVLYYFRRLISASVASDALKAMAFEDTLTRIGNRRRVDWSRRFVLRGNCAIRSPLFTWTLTILRNSTIATGTWWETPH